MRKTLIKMFLLKWLLGFAYFIEGLVAILTFGSVFMGLPIKTAKAYSREAHKLKQQEKK